MKIIIFSRHSFEDNVEYDKRLISKSAHSIFFINFTRFFQNLYIFE